MFVVYKIAFWIGLGIFPPLGHGQAVIAFVFHNMNAMFPKKLFFPCLGIPRHMHHRAKAQRRAHDADAHAQIACRADFYGVLAEKRAGLRL